MSIDILENSSHNLASLNLYSKLLTDNIILINEELNEYTVTSYQAQLLYLKSKLTPEETQENPIKLYINSPGGNVLDGLGLYDMIKYLQSKGYIISTVNIGSSCSMAALLLMSGTKGYRYSLKHCQVMIHELSSFNYGKFNELKDHYEQMTKLQSTLNKIIKINSSEEILSLCERKDLWLTADEAIKYNIIDQIL